MRKLKVAQIGIGHDHAPMILESMLRQNDIFEVKGFCVCEGEEGQFESKLKRKIYYKNLMRKIFHQVFLMFNHT